MRTLLALLLLSAGPDGGSPVGLSVPTRLAIARTATTLSVAVAEGDRREVTVQATPGLTLGVEHQLIVSAGGKRFAREGLSSGTDFNLGTSIFNRATDGLPVPGTAYRVEVKLVVFETDRPPVICGIPTARSTACCGRARSFSGRSDSREIISRRENAARPSGSRSNPAPSA